MIQVSRLTTGSQKGDHDQEHTEYTEYTQMWIT